MENEKSSEEIAAIRKQLPSEPFLYDLADFYRIFGDSTRIKILYALYEGELCVFDIAKILHMTQSAISHQLRILKDAKLVKFRRDGKTIYYSLDDDHIVRILELGTQHLEEE